MPTLVEAFARLAGDHPDLRLVLAGADGWGTEDARARHRRQRRRHPDPAGPLGARRRPPRPPPPGGGGGLPQPRGGLRPPGARGPGLRGATGDDGGVADGRGGRSGRPPGPGGQRRGPGLGPQPGADRRRGRRPAPPWRPGRRRPATPGRRRPDSTSTPTASPSRSARSGGEGPRHRGRRVRRPGPRRPSRIGRGRGRRHRPFQRARHHRSGRYPRCPGAVPARRRLPPRRRHPHRRVVGCAARRVPGERRGHAQRPRGLRRAPGSAGSWSWGAPTSTAPSGPRTSRSPRRRRSARSPLTAPARSRPTTSPSRPSSARVCR